VPGVPGVQKKDRVVFKLSYSQHQSAPTGKTSPGAYIELTFWRGPALAAEATPYNPLDFFHTLYQDSL
jgi:hypothetical protein